MRCERPRRTRSLTTVPSIASRCVTALVVVVAGIVTGTAGAAAAIRAEVTEYQLPRQLPLGGGAIAVADDGSVWLAPELISDRSNAGGAVLHFRPGSQTLTSIATKYPRVDRVIRMPGGRVAFEQNTYGGPPSAVSIVDARTGAGMHVESLHGGLRRAALAPDGTLWVVEAVRAASGLPFRDRLLRIGPGAAVRRFELTGTASGVSVDTDLVFDQLGGAWFMDHAASDREPRAALWRVDAGTGALARVVLPTPLVGGGSAARGGDGRLYFAYNVITSPGVETVAGGLFALDPEARRVVRIELPDGSHPLGVANGPDGKLWVTPEGSQGLLFRYDPAVRAFDRLTLPRAETLLSITPGVDDDVWITETGLRNSTTPGEPLEPFSVWRVRVGHDGPTAVALDETLTAGMQTSRRCLVACTVTARLERARRPAVTSSRRRSGRVVAFARARRARAGEVRLRLRFKKRVARALRRRAVAHLALRTRVRLADGRVRSSRTKVILRRSRLRLAR